MNSGRSLELFFVDGSPEGMLTAEVFNWTGHVLRIPRTQLAEGLKRKEARQTGVYLLIGANNEGGLAYIGESEDMAQRLSAHAKEKDWWDQAVLITAAGDALHKAHVKYLESRLIETALKSASSRLENGSQPAGASLNEAATANMESFLDTLHMVLPAIKVDIFQSGQRNLSNRFTSEESDRSEQRFEMTVPRSKGKAIAILIKGEMVVQAESNVRNAWVGDKKHATNYWKLHADLISKGIIDVKDGTAVFAEDYAFSGSSAASAVVAGRASNGRTEWKTPSGKTYAQWEAERLESSVK